MEAFRKRMNDAWDLYVDDDDEEHVINNMLLEDSQEEEIVARVWGGSRPGRSRNVERGRHEMHLRIMKDYFQEDPVYGPVFFRRLYRMRRELLLVIMDRVIARDDYFVQKPDACGFMGLSPHQKITAALRMQCYGICADTTDEYCRTSESTAMESLKGFCIAIRAEFEEQHMRQPSHADFEKQFAINHERGFPGMFASLDCMHWEWKNCPVAWQGDFGDMDGKKSIILEAIADGGLHIWHAFFGIHGSNNDLNVLDRSPLVQNMLTSQARDLHFTINGCVYDRYYLLIDGIYLEWSCFVQTIHLPPDEKRAFFSER
jgi:hypothetical protein